MWKYNAEFNQTMSHLDWDKEAGMAQYRVGLKGEVKDAMIYFEKDPSSLDQLMKRAQLADRRIWDSKMEKRFGKTTMKVRQQNKNGSRPRFARDRDGDVMMTGASAMTKDECGKKHLCFNCGKQDISPEIAKRSQGESRTKQEAPTNRFKREWPS
jgi:hypothetical protein